jgi:hypothetical protein
MTAGPDGNLWFTEADGHRIGRITVEGVVTMFPAHLGQGSPCGIASGADGGVWFTEADGNRIGRISPSGAVSVVRGPSAFVHREDSTESWYSRCGIAAGPDGDMWFTEWEADRIGRVTPAGVISEYPPTAVITGVRLRTPATVAVRLRCPAASARECRGTVRLHSVDYQGLPRFGVSRFTLAPGARMEIPVRLWARARRLLRSQRVLPIDVLVVPSVHGMAGAVGREATLRLL